MAAIDLMLDEENELTFQLNVEGTRPGEASCRLVIENTNMSFYFEGQRNVDGELSVVLPPLNHVLKEGSYDMSLEVIVDDRYFKPLALEGNFEKSIKVSAAPVKTKRKKKTVAAASLLEVKKPTRKRSPISEFKSRPKKSKGNPSDDEIMNIIKMITKDK